MKVSPLQLSGVPNCVKCLETDSSTWAIGVIVAVYPLPHSIEISFCSLANIMFAEVFTI